MELCRLCTSTVIQFSTYKERVYHRCSECFLIQLMRSQCPSNEDEYAEYQLHRNDPYDKGYRQFLSKVTKPMLEWLRQNQREHLNILDFGSGPGPTISVVLAEQGWTVVNYDPFFSADETVLEHHYDLISSTEVVEHFYEPQQEWKQLFSLLKEEGQLVVMTQCSDDFFEALLFQRWRYIQEQSHVVFYHSRTMHWLARTYGFQLTVLNPSVFWFSRGTTDIYLG